MQMKTVRIRDSKFGPALVIETTSRSGGYILGFRLDPEERMQETFKEVQSLHQVFSQNPIFGVEHSIEEKLATPDELVQEKKQDDVEIINNDEDSGDAFAAYYADENKNVDREPIFSPELGLAVERLRDGFT